MAKHYSHSSSFLSSGTFINERLRHGCSLSRSFAPCLLPFRQSYLNTV